MSRQQFEYHPVIGYRFIPNLKARIPHESGGYLVKTNNLGFRSNHDFHLRKKPGMNRILLFGDSFTAGDGVSNHKRYGDLLEKSIPNLEVYNFGLPGTCTGQQYLIYKEYTMEMEHDLLIIAVYIQNILRTASRYRYYMRHDEIGVALYAKPYYELIDGKLILNGVPPPSEPVNESDLSKIERDFIEPPLNSTLQWFIMKTKIDRIVFKATFGWDPYPGYKSPNKPKWLLLSAILKEWIENHSQPVLLIPIPSFVHVEGLKNASNYRARFRELVKELSNCTLHDLLSDLLKYPLKERRDFRFKIDQHLAPKGHLALASSIVPAVERSLNTQQLGGDSPE